ncbi:hypothetical protein LPJ64_002032 [Coemansia asiatica]|uniref:Uncharacterized protein n=1 Tax=Coemansia asiatica TaxID=1052880 RepID=A0A9W7XKA4_9FUNG|nr:hypothetical protein LPJ64_002032 [Coemansia asiatica]
MHTEITKGKPSAWISNIKGRIKQMYDRQKLAEWLGNPLLYAGPFPGIGMCVAFSGNHQTASARSRQRFSMDQTLDVADATTALTHHGYGQDRVDDKDKDKDNDVDDAATLLEK